MRDLSIDAAIRRTATVVSAPLHGQWAIRMPEVRRLANIKLSSGWLSASVSLRRLSGPINLNTIRTLLKRNAHLVDSARIVAQRQQGKRQIVVEIPVELLPFDHAAQLDLLLKSVITSLKAALSTIRPSGAESGSVLPLGQVLEHFAEAGWPAQPRDESVVEVPLEVPGNYFTATVIHDSRSIRLIVPILERKFATASPDCRSAVTLLLWLASSRTRMVKPTVSRHKLSIEVALPTAHCNAIGLRHACAALSIALQQCMAEAAFLIADQDLAQIYLCNLGFSTST